MSNSWCWSHHSHKPSPSQLGWTLRKPTSTKKCQSLRSQSWISTLRPRISVTISWTTPLNRRLSRSHQLVSLSKPRSLTRQSQRKKSRSKISAMKSPESRLTTLTHLPKMSSSKRNSMSLSVSLRKKRRRSRTKNAKSKNVTPVLPQNSFVLTVLTVCSLTPPKAMATVRNQLVPLRMSVSPSKRILRSSTTKSQVPKSPGSLTKKLWLINNPPSKK